MSLAQALRDLIARYEFDGIPNDSLPAVEAARKALAEHTQAPEGSDYDADGEPWRWPSWSLLPAERDAAGVNGLDEDQEKK